MTKINIIKNRFKTQFSERLFGGIHINVRKASAEDLIKDFDDLIDIIHSLNKKKKNAKHK